MGVLRTLAERRREMWAMAVLRVYAGRTPEAGDVFGQPMPAGRYPEGDPRNDPEYEARHKEKAGLIERYMGTDIPSIVSEYQAGQKPGATPMDPNRKRRLISLVRSHKRDVAHGIGGATDELWNERPVGSDYRDAHGQARPGARVGWDPAREALHQRLLDAFEAQAVRNGVPRERKAIIMGGPSGAGKSSLLGPDSPHAKALGITHGGPDGKTITSHAVINPDDFKDMLIKTPGAIDFGRYEGLNPNELSSLVHEESSHLAELAARRMMAKGYNIIHDVTLAKDKSAHEKYVEGYDGSGQYPDRPKYDFTHAFVDGPIEHSRHNVGLRYKFKDPVHDTSRNWGGRFVDQGVVEAQAPTKPGYRSRNAQSSEEFSARPEIRHVYSYDPVTKQGGWVKRNGQGVVSHFHPELASPEQRAAASLHSGVSLERKEGFDVMHPIYQKIKDFHDGALTREQLVHYLAHEHSYEADEKPPRHNIAARWMHAETGSKGDWAQVEAAHQSGYLPRDIYLDVLRAAQSAHQQG